MLHLSFFKCWNRTTWGRSPIFVTAFRLRLNVGWSFAYLCSSLPTTWYSWIFRSFPSGRYWFAITRKVFAIEGQFLGITVLTYLLFWSLVANLICIQIPLFSRKMCISQSKGNLFLSRHATHLHRKRIVGTRWRKVMIFILFFAQLMDLSWFKFQSVHFIFTKKLEQLSSECYEIFDELYKVVFLQGGADDPMMGRVYRLLPAQIDREQHLFADRCLFRES